MTTEDHTLEPSRQPANQTQTRLERHMALLKYEAGAAAAAIAGSTVLAVINLAAANGDTSDWRFHTGIGCALAAVLFVVGFLALHGHHSSTSANLNTTRVVTELAEQVHGHDDNIGDRVGHVLQLAQHHSQVLSDLAVATEDEVAAARTRNGSSHHT